MKTLYVVSENKAINGDEVLVEIKRFLDREIAEKYIEKHQNLREEKIKHFEYRITKVVGQMSITQFPVCETLEEAESEV